MKKVRPFLHSRQNPNMSSSSSSPSQSLKKLVTRSPFTVLCAASFGCYAVLVALLLKENSLLQLLLLQTKQQTPSLAETTTTTTTIPPILNHPKPLPYSVLEKGCNKTPDPSDCFSTLSSIPSIKDATHYVQVMEIVIDDIIRSLIVSRFKLVSLISSPNNTTIMKPRQIGDLHGCIEFTDSSLYALRETPSRLGGVDNLLDRVLLYIFSCLQEFKEFPKPLAASVFENNVNNPFGSYNTVDEYVHSLFDGTYQVGEMATEIAEAIGIGPLPERHTPQPKQPLENKDAMVNIVRGGGGGGSSGILSFPSWINTFLVRITTM